MWLEETQPYLDLKAKDEKSGRGAHIPLRDDLAAELRKYVSEKRHRLKTAAPLSASMPLFEFPRSLVGIFDRDLAATGIEKQDQRGRSLDVHALRHTFGTHLSKAGVPPRVAQGAKSANTPKPVQNTLRLKKASALDSAVRVLSESKEPQTCKQMIETMMAKNYWKPSHGGKTPANTLYAAIVKEIDTRGKDSRFEKVGRGQFALAGA